MLKSLMKKAKAQEVVALKEGEVYLLIQTFRILHIV